jgi:carbonic anhydrase/acetyltransferase-like protein (isoleucine patch superfamily)
VEYAAAHNQPDSSEHRNVQELSHNTINPLAGPCVKVFIHKPHIISMIYPFEGVKPRIHETAYVAKNATVVGNVEIGAHSSIWPGAVLRGDLSSITIGRYTSIQDNCVIHVEGSLSDPSTGSPAVIGNYCTIGHGALLHGCIIGERVLIGAHAAVFNNARIGDGSILGMGCVISDNKEIPSRRVVVGIPGRIVREVTEEEWTRSKAHAELYAELAEKYKKIL